LSNRSAKSTHFVHGYFGRTDTNQLFRRRRHDSSTASTCHHKGTENKVSISTRQYVNAKNTWSTSGQQALNMH
jgi:hypothetical protein